MTNLNFLFSLVITLSFFSDSIYAGSYTASANLQNNGQDCKDALLFTARIGAQIMLNNNIPGHPTKYQSGSCHNNICNLVDYIEHKNINIDDVRFLYISRENAPGVTLYPAAKSGELAKQWTYHVVLLIGQNVIDLDYPQGPIPVPIDSYFIKMFGHDEANFNNLHAYSLPPKIIEFYKHIFPFTYQLHLRDLAPSLQKKYEIEIKRVGTPLTDSPGAKYIRAMLPMSALFEVNGEIKAETEQQRQISWNRNFKLNLLARVANNDRVVSALLYYKPSDPSAVRSLREDFSTKTFQGLIVEVGSSAFVLETEYGRLNIPYYLLADLE